VVHEDQTLQGRLQLFLRGRYRGGGGAKQLARDIDADPRTAKNILAGYWPGARHWRAIVRLFGRDVLEAVFEPEIADVLARQRAEIARLEKELANRRAHLRAVAGSAVDLVEAADR